jgi:non-lysosomal glucosylceramidase
MRNMKNVLLFITLIGLSVSVAAQVSIMDWPVLKTYTGIHTTEVAMPLGGIGTGTVSIGGRGDLRDWEITNRGALGWIPGVKLVEPTIANAPFFALYYKPEGAAEGEIKLLEGPIAESKYYGDWGCDVYNSGFPRFEATEFEAAYPLGQVIYKDSTVPLDVRLKAFNPMIPGDADNSSIPVAILTWEVTNRSPKPVSISVCGMIPNYIGMDGWGGKPVKNENRFVKSTNNLQGLFMYSNGVDSADVNWGTMALTTNSLSTVTYRTTWAKLAWNWTFREFLDDFGNDGELIDHGYAQTNDGPVTSDVMEDLLNNPNRYNLATPPATLAVKHELKAGEKTSVTFYITWHFPNRRGWDTGTGHTGKFGTSEIVGNYYTTQFKDALDVAQKVNDQRDKLEEKTVSFVRAFCESDLPEVIKEAALFNSLNMRSQTMFRTSDGYPFGFEGTGSVTGTYLGSSKSAGWGFGTCFHVWNYESAIPFLFGDISMKFREVEFLKATAPDGGMSHRVGLPLETNAQSFRHFAADGQMGTIVKIYRDWQLSGNDDKLKEMWPFIKKAMSFAWTGIWDQDKDGVMEGSQHNTMDINYEGPNPQMAGWYLAALKASVRMAEYLNDDDFAEECHDLYERGSRWVDENLFNGEYYEHIIPEGHNRVAQLGKGCLVDQLVGQYLAHTAGLGYVLDRNNVATTLQSIMKYNWVDNFNRHINTFRSFALGREAGLIMASYPRGELLDFPFPYYTEVMTGFEYSTAVHMIYEGQVEDGLKVFEAVRNRFDGLKRNPFNEGEYGHRYARAMAAWGGVLAYTGFQYSAVDKKMAFKPLLGKYFWSNGYQYGTVKISAEDENTVIKLLSINGPLQLKSFEIKGVGSISFRDTKIFETGVEEEFVIPETKP